jgi:hypothetical protein
LARLAASAAERTDVVNAERTETIGFVTYDAMWNPLAPKPLRKGASESKAQEKMIKPEHQISMTISAPSLSTRKS